MRCASTAITTNTAHRADQMLGNLEISTYLQELASAAATPGGGAAAALTSAQGAALLAMVCNLTLGKKKFVAVEAEIRNILADLEQQRQSLLQFADADVTVFQGVMAAYKLPKDTPEQNQYRSEQIQAALKASSEVPFGLFKACQALLPVADRLEQIGNPAVLSDVLVGRYLLKAGLLSAKANVDINIDSITDDAFSAEKRQFMAAAMGQGA